MDFDGVMTALAARFAPAQVTPPATYDNIRVSTADLPNQMTPLPTVLVFLESGEFTHFPGKRDSGHDFIVRFYLAETQDLPKETAGLRKWLAVLVNQLQASVTLSGTVTLARVTSYRVGIFNYAGTDYSGIELGVHVVVNEGWVAVA